MTCKSTLIVRVDPERRTWWKETLQELLPELKVVLWDEDEYDLLEIEYAVVWAPPRGGLAKFSNLKCVVSVGAGVSHILNDPTYPRKVPIIRTVNDSLRKRMAEYVLLHVLRFHRRLPEFTDAQQKREWVRYIEPIAMDITVGLLGLGNLGQAAASALRCIGYTVVGWRRCFGPVEGVEVFCGQGGLQEMLSRTNVLVCMLPHTNLTANILNAKTFGALPRGAAVINVGRGESLVEQDLITALDQGHLSGATLDVFREEPLPASSPLWTHRKVLVTCHTASAIEPSEGGKIIAQSIKTFMAGGSVPDIVDIDRGY